MNIAFCYESVLPDRGGCETYITDLARRLLAEGHRVHLYACRWDERRLPGGLQYHRILPAGGGRLLRPWNFARSCAAALAENRHDVSLGFNKTWGQDVLYPQGGLHAASHVHNLNKYADPYARGLMALWGRFDPAHLSFARLERRQYLEPPRPRVIAISEMVRGHFEQFYGIPAAEVHVVRAAVDPARFREHDRPRVRAAARERWGVAADETVGLLAAMNYRLKGLDPLLHAVRLLFQTPEYRARESKFRLLVVGHPDYRRYQRLADRLGVAEHVTFGGHCPEMREAYFAADFLVHPTFYDPCSLVVLEALACSLPVITTKYNGAGELLRPPHDGYIVDDPHDAPGLAHCLGQLLDPDRRQQCAVAARAAAGRWTLDDHYRALLRVFEGVRADKLAA